MPGVGGFHCADDLVVGRADHRHENPDQALVVEALVDPRIKTLVVDVRDLDFATADDVGLDVGAVQWMIGQPLKGPRFLVRSPMIYSVLIRFRSASTSEILTRS